MILGLGIDLCDTVRVRNVLGSPDRGFREAVFTASEIAECERRACPARDYAARFAAKEALVKALAAAGGSGTFWQDVEVTRRERGNPRLQLRGRAAELAASIGVARAHVSLTGTHGLAMATVILET